MHSRISHTLLCSHCHCAVERGLVAPEGSREYHDQKSGLPADATKTVIPGEYEEVNTDNDCVADARALMRSPLFAQEAFVHTPGAQQWHVLYETGHVIPVRVTNLLNASATLTETNTNHPGSCEHVRQVHIPARAKPAGAAHEDTLVPIASLEPWAQTAFKYVCVKWATHDTM